MELHFSSQYLLCPATVLLCPDTAELHNWEEWLLSFLSDVSTKISGPECSRSLNCRALTVHRPAEFLNSAGRVAALLLQRLVSRSFLTPQREFRASEIRVYSRQAHENAIILAIWEGQWKCSLFGVSRKCCETTRYSGDSEKVPEYLLFWQSALVVKMSVSWLCGLE